MVNEGKYSVHGSYVILDLLDGFHLNWHKSSIFGGYEPKDTLPETNTASLCLKIGRAPKGHNRLPVNHFQGLC